MPSNSIYLKKRDGVHIHQGDIFRDVCVVENIIENENAVTTEQKKLPYALVITQECDLQQDFNCRANSENKNQDKYLPSILLCPAYTAESHKRGDHLDGYGQKMEIFNSDRFRQLKQNNLYRYHYLEGDIDLNVPELVIDFKHYFTIPRQIAYSPKVMQNYLATISDLYREHLSSRFCFYLGRIGLPGANG